MIDLGQYDAIKNRTNYATRFQWQTVKQPYTYLCGTLCIIREGYIQAIEPQNEWQEYTGVFSLLNTAQNNTTCQTQRNTPQ